MTSGLTSTSGRQILRSSGVGSGSGRRLAVADPFCAAALPLPPLLPALPALDLSTSSPRCAQAISSMRAASGSSILQICCTNAVTKRCHQIQMVMKQVEWMVSWATKPRDLRLALRYSSGVDRITALIRCPGRSEAGTVYKHDTMCTQMLSLRNCEVHRPPRAFSKCKFVGTG